MSLDSIAILAYVILPTSSAHVICEPNPQVVACIVHMYIRGPFFAPSFYVLGHLLWFLGEYILFQANVEGYTTEVNQLGPILQTCVCRSINVSIA